MNQETQMQLEIEQLNLTAPKVSADTIEALMDKVTYFVVVPDGTTTTLVTAFLDGFSLGTGMTACVDPANFNAELGEKYATLNAEKIARDKLWELEGYVLKFHSK